MSASWYWARGPLGPSVQYQHCTSALSASSVYCYVYCMSTILSKYVSFYLLFWLFIYENNICVVVNIFSLLFFYEQSIINTICHRNSPEINNQKLQDPLRHHVLCKLLHLCHKIHKKHCIEPCHMYIMSAFAETVASVA